MTDGINIEIDVPCIAEHASIAQQFTVKASLPGEHSITWPTKLGGKLVDHFTIKFDNSLESEHYAEMIVSMSNHNDDWEFYGNGIEIITSGDHGPYEFSSKLISPKAASIKINKALSHDCSTSEDINDKGLNDVIKIFREGQKLSVSFRYAMLHKPTNDIYFPSPHSRSASQIDDTSACNTEEYQNDIQECLSVA